MKSRPWWRDPIVNRRASLHDAAGEPKIDWWGSAVIYQLSPWSFQDSNDDGIGDLQGIIQRLDYIGSLGVDAIWLTPVFVSPMDDFGYDVTGEREIAPLFGTREDFTRLVESQGGLVRLGRSCRRRWPAQQLALFVFRRVRLAL